jgi:hypothetical protein
VWNLIAVLALAVASPPDVTATKLDGTAATGLLESWSASELALTTPSGSVTIPAAEVLSIQFSNVPVTDTGKPLLELVDGSQLPLAEFTKKDDRIVTRSRTPSHAEAQSLDLAKQPVRAVRLQPLDVEVLPQWAEIRSLDLPSDVIVVVKRGGKSLDYLECILGEVTETEVEFTVDEKQMRVPRDKVAGLIYYHADESDETTPQCVLTGSDGLRIAAAKTQWMGNTIRAKTVSGLDIAWPLAGITAADLSAGKVAFLSDIEPATETWQPLIALPTGASQAAKYGDPRFNESSTGGPLMLLVPNANPTDTGSVQTFPKGLALRSHSELVYRLPRGYSRLLATAGIDPAAAANGNVLLTIYGDDRVLLETTFAGATPPLPIELDVADVKRLKIVVDYGDNLDTGDWLNLCNARIVK